MNHNGQTWYWADVLAKGYVEDWANMELDLQPRFAGAFWSPHKATFTDHSFACWLCVCKRKKGVVTRSHMSPGRTIIYLEETWVWIVWRDWSVSTNNVHWDTCPSLSTPRWKIKADGQGLKGRHLLPAVLTVDKTFFEMEEMWRRGESDRENWRWTEGTGLKTIFF